MDRMFSVFKSILDDPKSLEEVSKCKNFEEVYDMCKNKDEKINRKEFNVFLENKFDQIENSYVKEEKFKNKKTFSSIIKSLAASLTVFAVANNITPAKATQTRIPEGYYSSGTVAGLTVAGLTVGAGVVAVLAKFFITPGVTAKIDFSAFEKFVKEIPTAKDNVGRLSVQLVSTVLEVEKNKNIIFYLNESEHLKNLKKFGSEISKFIGSIQPTISILGSSQFNSEVQDVANKANSMSQGNSINDFKASYEKLLNSLKGFDKVGQDQQLKKYIYGSSE